MQTVVVGPADTEFLYAVFVGVRSADVVAWGWTPAQQEAFLRMQFQLQRQAYAIQFPDADHRLILHEGKPVGQILVDRQPDAIRLVDIALLPAYRGFGIGAALIRQLQEEARRVAKPLRLTVRKGNEVARRLYQRLGFLVTAESDLDDAMEWNV